MQLKYLSENDGTAVFKYETSADADTAKAGLTGAVVGHRKITVNYNKRLNFVQV